MDIHNTEGDLYYQGINMLDHLIHSMSNWMKMIYQLLDMNHSWEKLDRSLVRKVISAKKRVGWGMIKWTTELVNELQKPLRRKFQKKIVFLKNVDVICAEDLVEMQPFSKFNNGIKYILMIIEVFSKN